MKRLTALILLLTLLPLCGLPAHADGEAIRFQQVINSIYYIPSLRRFVNNARGYGTEKMSSVVQNLNRALDAMQPRVPTYLYLVESSRSHQMNEPFSEDSPAYLYLKSSLHVDQADHLKFSTFEQYCELFYATDHHWNHRGSYQGYVDIVRMLLGDSEPVLTPAEEVTLPVVFNGSYAKEVQQPVSQERFTLYRFDPLPAYVSYVNGRKMPYDRIESYLNGKYDSGQYANHYHMCYGGNPALLEMVTPLADRENLLIFCNSQGSPVKTLLANHFHRIVCVDLRYYEKQFGQAPSLNQLIEEYEIDRVLLLGDALMFINADSLHP